MSMDGDAATARRLCERTLAVATIGRDQESLKTEARMEQGSHQ